MTDRPTERVKNSALTVMNRPLPNVFTSVASRGGGSAHRRDEAVDVGGVVGVVTIRIPSGRARVPPI